METGNPTGNGASTIEERIDAVINPKQEEETFEGEEKQEENQEEAPKEDGTEEPGPQISTADVAALFGVDEGSIDADEEGNVLIKTKIDGQEGKAKLTDLIASYQLRGHADNQVREAAEQKKAAAELKAKYAEEVSAKLQEVDALASVLHSELTRDFQGVDWQQLRVENPGEYAAYKADFDARMRNIQMVKMQADLKRQEAANINAQQSAEMLAVEARKVSEKIPGWGDQATADKEKAEITEWAAKYFTEWGEDPAILGQVNKGIFVSLLRDAMMYHKQQGKKPEIENKIRLAPKLVKPGQSKTADEVNAEGVKNLRKNIKQSGGKKGIAEYLIATGKV